MRGRSIGTAVASAIAVFAVAAGSRVPVTFDGEDSSLVRLSWRTSGLSLHKCRRLSEEELAALPVHMRTPEVCTGGVADYELRAQLSGREVLIDTIRPGGAHADRPIYVFSDMAVTPGHHDLSVTFRALVPPDYPVGDAPTFMKWEGSLELAPREIALITTDAAGVRLVRGERAAGP